MERLPTNGSGSIESQPGTRLYWSHFHAHTMHYKLRLGRECVIGYICYFFCLNGAVVTIRVTCGVHRALNVRAYFLLVFKIQEIALSSRRSSKTFKVRLTPNMIFGLCNIWVILRRNVIYLNSKKTSSSSTFSLSKFPDMRSLAEFLVQKNKGKLICNSPNDIISGHFDSEKVDQDGIFLL